MTTEPRFLALVAKVDNTLDILSHFQQPLEPSTMEYDLDWTSRALKGEIMRHEPREGIWGGLVCSTCEEGRDPEPASWPCKPFLDMEAKIR